MITEQEAKEKEYITIIIVFNKDIKAPKYQMKQKKY